MQYCRFSNGVGVGRKGERNVAQDNCEDNGSSFRLIIVGFTTNVMENVSWLEFDYSYGRLKFVSGLVHCAYDHGKEKW